MVMGDKIEEIPLIMKQKQCTLTRHKTWTGVQGFTRLTRMITAKSCRNHGAAFMSVQRRFAPLNCGG